jgi:hypothetical protein
MSGGSKEAFVATDITPSTDEDSPESSETLGDQETLAVEEATQGELQELSNTIPAQIAKAKSVEVAEQTNELRAGLQALQENVSLSFSPEEVEELIVYREKEWKDRRDISATLLEKALLNPALIEAFEINHPRGTTSHMPLAMRSAACFNKQLMEKIIGKYIKENRESILDYEYGLSSQKNDETKAIWKNTVIPHLDTAMSNKSLSKPLLRLLPRKELQEYTSHFNRAKLVYVSNIDLLSPTKYGHDDNPLGENDKDTIRWYSAQGNSGLANYLDEFREWNGDEELVKESKRIIKAFGNSPKTLKALVAYGEEKEKKGAHEILVAATQAFSKLS